MGPREGWPSNQPEQSSPPNLVPYPVTPPLPISGLPALQHGRPSLWPLRSCHLGYAIPVEVGDRGPHLEGLTPPRHPSFYSKALTVIWGLAPASPSLWLPKGPVLTEPQATDRPGQGRPCCQRPGHPHPNSLLHMQCLVWDPVYKHC
ncbi:hypothetical protein mRhiFer1_008615 [Rhinolophus ferrumequinum]|uniref:Uncharacterized protein n=1 Tax=Rhinolophus ferrumequinum TaxID=59479 RepID=A0A7J7U0Y9_RHIFE|nr:hypothetical protein mRhiFer1_008615 [Rhinolophus ferrumequinum]